MASAPCVWSMFVTLAARWLFESASVVHLIDTRTCPSPPVHQRVLGVGSCSGMIRAFAK